MYYMKRSTLQPGEYEFIENVVKAIISNDLSRQYFLINDKGIMKSKTVQTDSEDTDVEFRYENGERVKIVCIFGKELINNFHYKSGNDDLAIPWARRSVKAVIEHGKMISSKIEW